MNVIEITYYKLLSNQRPNYKLCNFNYFSYKLHAIANLVSQLIL